MHRHPLLPVNTNRFIISHHAVCLGWPDRPSAPHTRTWTNPRARADTTVANNPMDTLTTVLCGDRPQEGPRVAFEPQTLSTRETLEKIQTLKVLGKKGARNSLKGASLRSLSERYSGARPTLSSPGSATSRCAPIRRLLGHRLPCTCTKRLPMAQRIVSDLQPGIVR